MNEISLDDNLELLVVDQEKAVRRKLSPGEALDLAENLIRRGTRKMMTEEATALSEEQHHE